MHDIDRLLAIARRRLETTSFIAVLTGVLAVLSAIVLAAAIADRLPAESFVPWAWAGPALGAVTLGVAALIWARRRPTRLEIAIVVDERLVLKERLSTALACAQRQDAFARAAIEDAVRTAQDPRTRERLGRSFRVESPRRWWMGPAMLLVAVGILFLPQANLFAEDEVVAEDAVVARQVAHEEIDALVQSLEQNPELAKELGDAADELAGNGTPENEPKRAEEIKRDAIKKVTELNQRLDDLLNGETGKTSEAIERSLAGLKLPEKDGDGRELAEALAKGDFNAAQEALQKMLDAAQNGEMDAEAQEALAKQLQGLGDQLQQLAQQQQALQNALANAGLDPQLANNPQALQQALQNAQQLNQAQRQQLQQMVQAQQAAQNACRGLGQACQGLGQAMAQGAQAQMGQMGGQMAGQLNQLEQMQMMLQQAQAMQGMCQGACQGMGMNTKMAQGKGMGKRGQGAGGKAPIAPTPTGTVMKKADAPMGEGEIIATMLIDGQPTRGDVKSTLKQIVSVAAEGYDEATGEDVLPRRYHEAQKHYFGELKAQVEKINVQESEAAPAPSESTPPAPPTSGGGGGE